MAGEQRAGHRAEPAGQFVLPVQLQVLEDGRQLQQHAAVALQGQLVAVQQAGLVVGQRQAQQHGSRALQAAVGLDFPVCGQLQAVGAGEQVQLDGRCAALHGNHPAAQTGQAWQCGAVHGQQPVQAEFDPGIQPAEQHQGLIPRCRATMPPVMLW